RNAEHRRRRPIDRQQRQGGGESKGADGATAHAATTTTGPARLSNECWIGLFRPQGLSLIQLLCTDATRVVSDAVSEPRWLLLIHQIPPKPAYFRVRIWRRLQAMGAVAIKNSVYVAPKNDETQEDFEWLLREIVKGGGDASICEARFIEGLEDDGVEALFNAARESDYRQLADDARAVAARASSREAVQTDVEAARLRRRLAAVGAIDFFGAAGREIAEGPVSDLEQEAPSRSAPALRTPRLADLRGRTWVTRKGVHIDRIASVWLVRRFVDEQATFKFVPARGYRPEPGEVRFDMFEAEFTHDGDRCTF